MTPTAIELINDINFVIKRKNEQSNECFRLHDLMLNEIESSERYKRLKELFDSAFAQYSYFSFHYKRLRDIH